MMDYLRFCFTNYIEFWIMYFTLIAMVLFISVLRLLEDSHCKRGKIDKQLFENMTLIIPVAKTIYTVVGHFSKTSKCTAKDKVTRLIKKEIQK